MVVSLAGYNTVCEILGAGTPAVLVPRMGHRREQMLRAARLAALGLVEYVPPAALEPRALAAAIKRALQRGRGRPLTPRLDGLDRVVAAVRRLLPAPAAETVAAAATAVDP